MGAFSPTRRPASCSRDNSIARLTVMQSSSLHACQLRCSSHSQLTFPFTSRRATRLQSEAAMRDKGRLFVAAAFVRTKFRSSYSGHNARFRAETRINICKRNRSLMRGTISRRRWQWTRAPKASNNIARRVAQHCEIGITRASVYARL